MIRISLTILLLAQAGHARADLIELDSGGAIRGHIVRDDSDDRSVLVVDTPWGRVALKRGDVARVSPEPPGLAEYHRRAPTVSDTAESQMALALWCRDRGLADELRVHAGRVLELDPDHEEARRLLGHRRVNGEWMTRDALLASRGLTRHDGEYRTRHEIELAEREKRREQTRREWRERVFTLREQLDSPNPEAARQAARRLTEVSDPQAVAPLIELLNSEQSPRAKPVLIRALGGCSGSAALGALVRIALDDPDTESRALSLEQLAASGSPGLAGPFVAALSSSNNARINLAADGLLALGATGAADALINALVTTHKFRVGNESGGDTYSVSRGAGTHSFGGGRPKVVKRQIKNPRVLNALVALLGVNFSYDQSAWQEWLANQQITAEIDLRRD